VWGHLCERRLADSLTFTCGSNLFGDPLAIVCYDPQMKRIALAFIVWGSVAVAGPKEPDSCSVLTADEIKAVVGAPVTQGGLIGQVCPYQGGKVLASAAVVRSDGSEADAKKTNEDTAKLMHKSWTSRELHGVGQWAFLTTTGHGGLVTTHKGHYLLTITLEIVPDLAADKLEAELVALTKSALAKL